MNMRKRLSTGTTYQKAIHIITMIVLGYTIVIHNSTPEREDNEADISYFDQEVDQVKINKFNLVSSSVIMP